MKKLIASLAAVALFAAPAMAELAQRTFTIPKGSYTVRPYDPTEVERHYSVGEGLYNNLSAPTRASINNPGFFVGDDAHMAAAGNVTSFHWIYVDGGAAASHTSTIAFFANTPGDGAPVLGNTLTFTSGGFTYGAIFAVTGLPQGTVGNPNGGWLISVGLPAFAAPQDVWAGIASTSTTPGGAIGPGMRPGLRAGNVPTVGSSHDIYWAGFAATAPYTSFFPNAGVHDNLRMAIIPEPAAAAVLAIGGLLALRRRRA